MGPVRLLGQPRRPQGEGRVLPLRPGRPCLWWRRSCFWTRSRRPAGPASGTQALRHRRRTLRHGLLRPRGPGARPLAASRRLLPRSAVGDVPAPRRTTAGATRSTGRAGSAPSRPAPRSSPARLRLRGVRARPRPHGRTGVPRDHALHRAASPSRGSARSEVAPGVNASSYSPFDHRRVVNASAYRGFLLAAAGIELRSEPTGWRRPRQPRLRPAEPAGRRLLALRHGRPGPVRRQLPHLLRAQESLQGRGALGG